mgnify:CR=1 FL=1
MEFHFEEVTASDLSHVVDNILVVQQRSLNQKKNTIATPVGSPGSQGTKTPSRYYPDFGAVLPQPFVEFFPSGRKLA